MTRDKGSVCAAKGCRRWCHYGVVATVSGIRVIVSYHGSIAAAQDAAERARKWYPDAIATAIGQ